MLERDPQLTSHLADWAFFAAPDNPAVLQLGLDVYAERIKPGLPLQEILMYVAHMADLKWCLKNLERR